MPLFTIYIIFLVMTIGLFFVKINSMMKYKKMLMYGHFVLLFFLLIDIFLITRFNTSLKSIWTDRILVLSVLITGGMICAVYFTSLHTLAKAYFGTFIIYPTFVALAYIIDKIFFIVVASPLLVALNLPEIYYSDNNYEIRGVIGLMAPKQVELVQKNYFTESKIGDSYVDFHENGYVDSFKIIEENRDSILVRLNNDGERKILTFSK